MGVVLAVVCFLAAWLAGVVVICVFVSGAACGAAATAALQAADRRREAAAPPQSWPQTHREPAHPLAPL